MVLLMPLALLRPPPRLPAAALPLYLRCLLAAPSKPPLPTPTFKPGLLPFMPNVLLVLLCLLLALLRLLLRLRPKLLLLRLRPKLLLLLLLLPRASQAANVSVISVIEDDTLVIKNVAPYSSPKFSVKRMGFSASSGW
jgi:hypothetical protein